MSSKEEQIAKWDKNAGTAWGVKIVSGVASVSLGFAAARGVLFSPGEAFNVVSGIGAVSLGTVSYMAAKIQESNECKSFSSQGGWNHP